MRVVLLKLAKQDIKHAYEFVASDNKAAARDLLQAIEKAIDILGDSSLLGREGRVSHTRELILGSLPYIIVYRVNGERVEVLSIMHTSRAWPDNF